MRMVTQYETRVAVAKINISKINGVCKLDKFENLTANVEMMLGDIRRTIQTIYKCKKNFLQVILRPAKKSRVIVETVLTKYIQDVNQKLRKVNIFCEIQYRYDTFLSNRLAYSVVFTRVVDDRIYI